MIKTILLFLSAVFCNGLLAQNPIIPRGINIADPSAHVWNDGKLYIYGSRDDSTGYYCSWNYHVFSTLK